MTFGVGMTSGIWLGVGDSRRGKGLAPLGVCFVGKGFGTPIIRISHVVTVEFQTERLTTKILSFGIPMTPVYRVFCFAHFVFCESI